MKITSKSFGQQDGTPIHLHTLRNAAGNEACISTLGATLTRWTAPDAAGRKESIVLGFENGESYLTQQTPYLNSVVGRYANRIAGGKFAIGEEIFQVSQNEGANHLHGGFSGFDKRIWQAVEKEDALEMHHTSPAGEEGYPGTLKVVVAYKLDDQNTLHISYRATTNAPTIVNLTMHGWFNLSGNDGSTVLDHRLRIAANKYTPTEDNLIPTGEIVPVEKTVFDFRKGPSLKDAISRKGAGYDGNFVLNTTAACPDLIGSEEDAAVEVYHSKSGRLLQIFTDQPGMQLYTGQGLDGTLKTDAGIPIPKWGGLVLEPQRFPDTPNEPLFGNAVLVPKQVYEHNSFYRCTVHKTLPATFALP